MRLMGITAQVSMKDFRSIRGTFVTIAVTG